MRTLHRALGLILAAALPLAAQATTITLTGSDSTLVGSNVIGSVSSDLNLNTALHALSPAFAYTPIDGVLTLTFAENAAVSSSSSSYSYGTTDGHYTDVITVTQTTTTDTTPQSSATVSLGDGNSATGAATSTFSTGDVHTQGNLQLLYSWAGYSYYTRQDTDLLTGGYRGDFTVSLDLNAANLSSLATTGLLDYTIAGSNSPKLLSDSLSVDYSEHSAVPAPYSAGLLLVGLAGALRRRRAAPRA